jgi:hypothetical protein
MREIKIKVHSNKKMSCLNGSFTCKKGENKIDVLVFDVDENLLQYNNFLILKSPNGTTYVDIVLSDMKYSIGSFITNELGNWTIQFLSSTQEDIVSEEEIDETQTIMISDSLSFNVIDSLASGELVLPPTSSNLDLLGQELANLYNTFYTLIQDYPEIEEYIEVQEQLEIMTQEMKKTQEMISNIKIDVGEVTIDNTEVLNAIDEVKEDIANINVDLSPISSKLDDLSDNVANIPTNDYSANLEQIQSDTTQIKGRVSSVQSMIESVLISNTNAIKSNTEYTQESVETIKNRIGNDDTKADGTLFNYSYWGLVRAEEAKSAAQVNTTILQTISSQLSDANTLSDEILALLEG